MKMIEAEFRGAILDYLERAAMSGGKLGEPTLGDPEFVPNLKRGVPPDLDAVDRVLRLMDIAPIGPRFRREVEAFLIVTGTGPTLLGTRAIGNSSFVRELRSGGSPTLDSVERVRSWMHGAADDFQRLGIAWLLASDVTVPPYAQAAKGEPRRDRPACGARRRRHGSPPVSRGAHRQCLMCGVVGGNTRGESRDVVEARAGLRWS